MPFLTEDIWHYLKARNPEEALIVSDWPAKKGFDVEIINNFETTKQVISGIRNLRKQKQIAFKTSIELHILNNDSNSTSHDDLIAKLGNISVIQYIDNPVDNAFSFRVGANEYFLIADIALDVESERSKVEEELRYTEGFLKSVQKKLSNERFVSNAPEQVVANEKKKEADALAKIETLKRSLKNLM